VLVTYMHSAWNSCPQGRLMTRLAPSTYSSRQTTHSTCLPMYFLHSLDPLRAFFLWDGGRLVSASSGLRTLAVVTSAVVRDRGRDLDEPCSNGGVRVELAGDGVLDDWVGEDTTVCHVRTGS
jgi:hypothetical protein